MPRSAPAKTGWSRRIHRNLGLALAVLGWLAFVARSDAGLKIYYLRHAEGGHNVVKEWANVPKPQWPAYVGNPNVFTPKGKEQVVAATEKLQKYHFDFIAVSSMWRTRNTILPYLKAVSAKGEIWPELHEFGGGSKILSAKLPAVTQPVLDAGPLVKLPADEAPYFALRADARNDFKLPSAESGEREAAAQLVVRRVVDMIRERFGGTEETLLLVGHGNAGRVLLRRLTNLKLADIPSMVNAELWMVEQQPDGTFQLELYNDAPCGKDGPAPAHHR